MLATLGETPTAAIAVAAIVLGLLFAARGPRGERRAGFSGTAGDGADPAEPAVAPLDVPIGEPEVEPGFVGPEGTVVGHGPIVLGGHGPLSGGSPAPPPALEPPPAPADPPEPQAQAEPSPRPIPFKQGTIKFRKPPEGG